MHRLRAFATAGALALAVAAGTATAQASSYESAVLADSPSAYWRLGESSGSVAADRSGNGNDCTYASSGVTLGRSGAVAGDSDTAAAFTAPGIVACPSGASVLGTQAFTYEAWVRTTSSSGYQYLIAQRDSGAYGADGETTLYLDGGYVKFFTGNGSVDMLLQGPDSLADGGWHQVVVTRDAIGAAVLYVDGAVVDRAIGSTSLVAHEVFLAADGRDSTHYFDGELDEVAIYPVALDAGQVGDHYGLGMSSYEAAVLADGPLAYWRLGESSGSVAADRSGNGNDCTYASTGVTLGSAGGISDDPDTAATFAAPGIVGCPSGASVLGTQGFTYEVWVRTTASSGYQYLMSQRDSSAGGADGETTLYLDGGYVTFFTGNGSVDMLLRGPEPVDDGEWHHLVVTRDALGSAVLYVDGVAVDRAIGSTSLVAHEVFLAADGRDSTHYFDGDLDEVAIYGYALDARAVDNHFGIGSGRP